MKQCDFITNVFFIILHSFRLQLEARLGITQPKSPTEGQPEPSVPLQSLPQLQQADDGKRKSARRKE